MELWQKIKGFENYEISSWGRVRNSKGQIIKPYKNHNGYLKVELYRNGKGYKFRVHRLVAEAFIDNLLKLPQVNHKDGNRENNSITNLEWVTDKENKEHSRKMRQMAYILRK